MKKILAIFLISLISISTFANNPIKPFQISDATYQKSLVGQWSQLGSDEDCVMLYLVLNIARYKVGAMPSSCSENLIYSQDGKYTQQVIFNSAKGRTTVDLDNGTWKVENGLLITINSDDEEIADKLFSIDNKKLMFYEDYSAIETNDEFDLDDLEIYYRK